MAKQVEYVDWPDALDVWTPPTPPPLRCGAAGPSISPG